MALDRLFQLTEEIITEKLNVEAVDIKLDGAINKEKCFICTVQKDDTTFVRTPKLLLQQFLITGPDYILNNLIGIERKS